MIRVVVNKGKEPSGIFIPLDQFKQLKNGLPRTNPIYKAMERVEKNHLSIADFSKEEMEIKLKPAFNEIKSRRLTTSPKA